MVNESTGYNDTVFSVWVGITAICSWVYTCTRFEVKVQYGADMVLILDKNPGTIYLCGRPTSHMVDKTKGLGSTRLRFIEYGKMDQAVFYFFFSV